MRSFWSDPYLWIHLAGIAALPLFLELCLVGLAIGDPILPAGLEWLLLAVAGIGPVMWMQWQKPFCIFCLLVVALKPTALTDDQRKLLGFFKSEESRILAIVTAVFLAWVLWQIYYLAPMATTVAPNLPGGRLVGLLLGAIAFLLSNLFLQVPVSVVRVLFASEAKVASAIPYPVERVYKDFTLLGWPVKRILPSMMVEPEEKPSRPMATSGTEPGETSVQEFKTLVQPLVDGSEGSVLEEGSEETWQEDLIASSTALTEETLAQRLGDSSEELVPGDGSEAIAEEGLVGSANPVPMEPLEDSLLDLESPGDREEAISEADPSLDPVTLNPVPFDPQDTSLNPPMEGILEISDESDSGSRSEETPINLGEDLDDGAIASSEAVFEEPSEADQGEGGSDSEISSPLPVHPSEPTAIETVPEETTDSQSRD